MASPTTPSTPAADLEAARAFLRETLDDDEVSVANRLQAATQLGKLIVDTHDDPVAERQAMQLTDNELLLVIQDARERRAAAAAAKGGVPPGIGTIPQSPGTPGPGERPDDFDWSTSAPEVPRGTPAGMDDFAALFADVPDLPPSAEELMS